MFTLIDQLENRWSAMLSTLSDDTGVQSLPSTHWEIGDMIKHTVQDERHGLWITYRPTSRVSGEWYLWNGRVHTVVDEEVDDKLAIAFIKALDSAKIKWSSDDDKKKAEKKFIAELRRSVKSNGSMNAIKARVRSELRVPMDHFDGGRNLLVLKDGSVLDTDSVGTDSGGGDLMKPSPTRPVTRHLGVSWIEEGAGWLQLHASRWHAWLDEFVPDREEQDFLQEAAGAALLGGGDAKNIVHLVGPKNSGKSTYLNIMEAVFGRRNDDGYAGTLMANAIVKKYGGSTNFGQSAAKGVRFLKLSEPSTDKTDDSFLKNLAGGGEPIATERKGQDQEEWLAECVLHVAANSVVRFDTSDPAIVDRVNIVEFNTVVPSGRVKFDFVEKLIEKEGPGILMWVIEGAERYRDQGHIVVPESITTRSKSNVVNSSAPLRWLEELLEKEGCGYEVVGGSIAHRNMAPENPLWDAYVEWAFESGEQATSRDSWKKEIESYLGAPAGFNTKKRNGGDRRLWGVRQIDYAERALKVHQSTAPNLTSRSFKAMIGEEDDI